jgi:hypothetical protein
MEITTLKEDSKGCGFRHSGPDGVGLYLMGDGIFEPCERLSFPLGVCPCCGSGTRFSRGWTWITPSRLFKQTIIPSCTYLTDFDTPPIARHDHQRCSMCNPPEGKHGLFWIGHKFYSPQSFALEAVHRGISKRIASVPRGFKFGETIVYLAHIKAIEETNEEGKKTFRPGVFMTFHPTHVDIVVDVEEERDLPEKAIHLAKKFGDNGRLVRIVKNEQQDLPLQD